MSFGHTYLLPAVIAMSALGAHGAAAQTMEFGCPAPATKMTNSAGATITFGKQDGFFCKVEHSALGSGDIYALMYFFNDARRRDPSVAKYISPIAVERLWPLSVGKRHQGEAVLGDGTYALQYTVTGTEVLATPMGPQTTFVVELKESSPNGYGASQKWWISPTFKYVLKSEFKDSRGANVSIHVTSVRAP